MDSSVKVYTYFEISGRNLIISEFTKMSSLTPTKTGGSHTGEKFWKYRINASDSCEGLEKVLGILLVMS